MHLISKQWHDNRKVDVIFSLQVFIHMAYMIDNKMMCHYIHNMIIKLFHDDSKMTINISLHIKNYSMYRTDFNLNLLNIWSILKYFIWVN
jgi:hypothetical protein